MCNFPKYFTFYLFLEHTVIKCASTYTQKSWAFILTNDVTLLFDQKNSSTMYSIYTILYIFSSLQNLVCHKSMSERKQSWGERSLSSSPTEMANCFVSMFLQIRELPHGDSCPILPEGVFLEQFQCKYLLYIFFNINY